MSRPQFRKAQFASVPTPVKQLPLQHLSQDYTEDDPDNIDLAQTQSLLPSIIPPQHAMSGLSLREKDNFDRIANIAREAYDATRVIMGELNVEQKMYVINPQLSSLHNWANLGGVIALNIVPQNVNEAGRTGDSIKMTNLMLDIRATSTRASWGINTVNYVRAFVFYVPGNNIYGSAFAVGGVDSLLEFSYGGTVLAPFAPKDYDGNSKKKVVIVHDHVFRLTAEDPQQHHHALIKLNKKTQYENDTTTINTGALFMCFVGDEVTNQNQMAWSSRLYFVDN